MDRCETVIIGSGYFACGYARAHAGTLILEASQMLDRAFYGTMRGFAYAEQEEKMPKTREARAFLAHCRGLGIVRDGALCVNAMDAALCDYLTPDIPALLLGTTCTEIVRRGELYQVSFVNNEGRGSVLAGRVIVTERQGEDHLNILVEHKTPLPISLSARPAFYEGQSIVTYSLREPCDINHAKLAAYNMLSRELPADARVLHMATYLHSAPCAPHVDADGVLRLDEYTFGDPFSAMEGGELA